MSDFYITSARTMDELCRHAALEIAEDDIYQIRKFGKSATLTADTPEDVWSSGGTKDIQTTAEYINVVSTSIADDLGSTGAQYVQIAGVDADYAPASETIVMDGTTPVQSTNQYITINRMLVQLAGTGKTNAGTITATGATSASTQATIPLGGSITQQSHFTIPAGYTLFTVDVTLSVYRSSGTGTRNAVVEQMVYVPDGSVTYQSIRYGLSNTCVFNSTPRLLSKTPGKTTLWFRATAEANNTLVTSSVSYIMLKGDWNIRSEF